MSQLHYFMVAQQVVGDGNATIVNIFNRMTPNKLPAYKPPVTLAFGLVPDTNEVKDGKIKIRLQVVSPGGKIIADISGTAKRTTPAPKKGEVEGEISGAIDLADRLVLEEEGHYLTKLFSNDKEIATNSFQVSIDSKGEI